MDNAFAGIASGLPNELKLLLEWTKIEPEQNTRGRVSEPDWERFLALAEHHRLYPVVADRLRREGVKLDPDVLQRLRSMSDRNALRMLQLTAEMIEVSKLLSAGGVRSIMLKGPVLAQRLYGGLHLRTSKDLDLLVPENQIDSAEKILQNRGYKLDDQIPRIIDDLRWKTHHVSLSSPANGIQIELHWRLNPDTVRESTFDELWGRRSIVALSGYKVDGLGNEDLFVYLISHGARHGWFRLRWLADIDRLLRMPLRIALLHELLIRNEGRVLAGQAARLCSMLLETPMPDELRVYAQQAKARRLAEQALSIIQNIERVAARPNSHDVNKHYRLYMLSILSFRQKLLRLYGKLYPSSWDALLLPLPRSLHFLYIPLRPVLWLLRRYRTEPAWRTEDSR